MTIVVESPIEEMFLSAMASVGTGTVVFKAGLSINDIWARAQSLAPGCIVMSAQVPFGRYRCDFVIGASNGDRDPNVLCIECDGHEHHKLTAEQRDRDEERDDWMKKRRVKVMRFTGKQIARDPFKCAQQALAAVGVQTREGEPMPIGLALAAALPSHVDIRTSRRMTGERE